VNKGVVGLVVAAVGSMVATVVTGVMASGARDDATSTYDTTKAAEALARAANLAAASNLWLTLVGVAVIALLTVWAVRGR
jgi:hypothetical protein